MAAEARGRRERWATRPRRRVRVISGLPLFPVAPGKFRSRYMIVGGPQAIASPHGESITGARASGNPEAGARSFCPRPVSLSIDKEGPRGFIIDSFAVPGAPRGTPGVARERLAVPGAPRRPPQGALGPQRSAISWASVEVLQRAPGVARGRFAAPGLSPGQSCFPGAAPLGQIQRQGRRKIGKGEASSKAGGTKMESERGKAVSSVREA